MTSILSSLVLVWRRIRSNWRLMLVVFAGILAATTLLAAAPLYLGATSELGLRHTLEFEPAGVVVHAQAAQGVVSGHRT